MKRFLNRILLLLLPLGFLILYYVIMDPFRVVSRYDNYYHDTNVSLNRDFVSVNNYLNIYPKYKPNAFIFGNSRTIFYKASLWQRYYCDSLRVYHFDASGEDLYGMSGKIEWLDKRADRIEYALLMLDPDSFNVNVSKPAPLFNRPIQIDPQVSFLDQQWAFFKSFLRPKFFIAYTDWTLFKTVRPYMKEVLDMRQFDYERSTNEISYNQVDSIILVNPDHYYTEQRMDVFYPRDTTTVRYAQPLIKTEQRERLSKIKAIFDKHSTNYRVVIHPLYNLLKLDSVDMDVVVEIFGADKVYDFSGHNDWTNDYRNFYENSHYRSNISDSVLRVIYR